VDEVLGQVGLDPRLRDRYPHQLSGGQRQRVGLARSLAARPLLLVADEPTSALDVSVQAAILSQFTGLHAELGFSCLFISHDLAVVEYLCDRIAVMYLGQIVETGTREQIFSSPRHPYTRSLLAAATSSAFPAFSVLSVSPARPGVGRQRLRTGLRRAAVGPGGAWGRRLDLKEFLPNGRW
jgi:ABC-type oligopeptide transport system ATPase subunit